MLALLLPLLSYLQMSCIGCSRNPATLQLPAAVPLLKVGVAAAWPCAGVRVGCYANGFQTTTSQWMSGTDQGLLRSNPGKCITAALSARSA
jgi:hypothetical protein